MKRGFTLIEILVSVAILGILSSAALGFFASMFRGIGSYRENVAVSALADQYLEIARNLAYSQVGTKTGDPAGPLPDCPDLNMCQNQVPISQDCCLNADRVTYNNATYLVYYTIHSLNDIADPNYGAQDYKQIKLFIQNTTTGHKNAFLTTIAPMSMASIRNGGALRVKVTDSSGNNIPSARVNISNTSNCYKAKNGGHALDVTSVTDSSGNLTEVGLTACPGSYHIIATKGGYSTDQTYTPSDTLSPIKPDYTLSMTHPSDVGFQIDKLSNLVFKTLDQTCQPISGVGLEVRGEKIIGTNPSLQGNPQVLKFDHTYSSTNGSVSLSNIEPDSYTPLLTGSQYMIYGTSPVQSVNLGPDATESFNIILGNKTENSLIAVAKDASSNPVEGVRIELKNNVLGYDEVKYTGGSVWVQKDWQGVVGQEDDGNVSSGSLGLTLKKFGEDYVPSGELTSSVYDTGTTSTAYTVLNWQPSSQPDGAEIKFQIATSDTENPESWDFSGPTGVSSYYTTPGSSIVTLAGSGARYVRYKVFLSRAQDNPSSTPTLTNIALNYVSGCPTPGQVIFTGLTADRNYSITVGNNATVTDLDVKNYFIYQATIPQ